MRQVSRQSEDAGKVESTEFECAKQDEGGLSKVSPECFTKYRWFFQPECNTCKVAGECAGEAQLQRERLIQKIDDSLKQEKRVRSLYSEINPKLLDHNYDFLD